ncbi:adenosylhomocysteinase [Methanohalobium evestigatum Z-7303]|uniref:S-inosyl-L-homocysteine hydrolase n=1 Tax=Methanohalobium evestigatum (strain ATCC BAA-1072 / DSM 3721 / NBRC 107634 / OCM 161 / Z-7303) TaxID=644295 RepID=D7E8N1_METEZ|nr:adenosylhomocysteinase [Methanohalobium evestigatum]ADI73702.1 adenosylhomocysteinase [Methanohalobium evestigatum Z-7303]
MVDDTLLESGNQKIEWARNHMPVLSIIRDGFASEKPLKGCRIAMALHVEAKTAVLVETLASGGAEIAITGCNPLSTQDDVAAALDTRDNVSCYAKYNASRSEYYESINKVLDINPDITVDDGGDLIFTLHKTRQELLSGIKGGTEETTTGVYRLDSMSKDNALKMPVIAVNNAFTKYLFDNRYGTGQSTWDAINRTTNLLVAGKDVVVAGYGWCGRGCSMRAKGLGANVIVTEVNPVRALEARMDGYRVMTMDEAAKIGEIFITTTGNVSVLTRDHFKLMKDGVILANSGHFNVEMNLEELESMSKTVRTVRENIKEYHLGDRRIYLLADGRLVNLAAGDGHPAEVMDMSFSNQALCIRHLVDNDLDIDVHAVPPEIDTYIAELKLKALGIEIDELTTEQEKYMREWEHGT